MPKPKKRPRTWRVEVKELSASGEVRRTPRHDLTVPGKHVDAALAEARIALRRNGLRVKSIHGAPGDSLSAIVLV